MTQVGKFKKASVFASGAERPARATRLVGGVLHQKQQATRLESPSHLGDRVGEVGNSSEHQTRPDDIERVIGQREDSILHALVLNASMARGLTQQRANRINSKYVASGKFCKLGRESSDSTAEVKNQMFGAVELTAKMRKYFSLLHLCNFFNVLMGEVYNRARAIGSGSILPILNRRGVLSSQNPGNAALYKAHKAKHVTSALLVGLWLLSAILLSGAAFGSATDIYITPTGAGTCAGQTSPILKTPAFFNAAGNWGAGAGQIGPGTVVHICGTFATAFTFQGSGTAGNPITLLFESGAKFSQANWGNVIVINFSNRDWIVVDGGATGSLQAGTFVANGLIENTSVSSTSNPTVDTTAIQAMPTNNSIVKNMLIGTLYNKTIKDGNGGGDGIHLQGSNDLITNNDGLDMKQGFTIDCTSGGASNSVITGNRMHRFNWSFLSSDRNAATTCTNLSIHDNESYDTVNWDDDTGVTNNFHHNGVFISMTDPSNSSKQINLQIYNNYFHGDPGDKSTSMPGVFLDNETTGTTYTGTLIYNNLMVDESLTNTPSNAPIITKSNGGSPAVKAYNNTFFYQTANKGRCIMNQGAVLTVENNIGQACSSNIFISSGTVPTSDYNDFYLSGGSSVVEGPHSITTNPNLTGAFVPNAGSPVIGAALNLTSLAITPLNSDKAGNPRPAVAGWDIGAYELAGPLVTVGPSSFNFGSVTVGGSSSLQVFTLQNTGTATLNLTSENLQTGTNFTRFIQFSDCSTHPNLTPGGTCTIGFEFTPISGGAKSDNIVIVSNDPSSPTLVPLSGTGVGSSPVASLSPTSLSFPSQVINTNSTPQTIHLSNTGGATMNISSIAMNTGTQFSLTTTCGSTLGAGSTCDIVVTFRPTSAGAKSDSVQITDDAAGSPQSAPVSGTGIAAVAGSACNFSGGIRISGGIVCN